jgi:hypothetical protein
LFERVQAVQVAKGYRFDGIASEEKLRVKWSLNGSFRSRVAADAVEEIEVPARKFTWHEFAHPTVRLGLYRLHGASICAPAT